MLFQTCPKYCILVMALTYTQSQNLFRLFGWVIYSERSPDAENVILGATLEIQRLQREEIMEQQIMRQQVCSFLKYIYYFVYMHIISQCTEIDITFEFIYFRFARGTKYVQIYASF